MPTAPPNGRMTPFRASPSSVCTAVSPAIAATESIVISVETTLVNCSSHARWTLPSVESAGTGAARMSATTGVSTSFAEPACGSLDPVASLVVGSSLDPVVVGAAPPGAAVVAVVAAAAVVEGAVSALSSLHATVPTARATTATVPIANRTAVIISPLRTPTGRVA